MVIRLQSDSIWPFVASTKRPELAAVQSSSFMPLVVAEGALLDHILDHTYPIWNEGLTRAAYGSGTPRR